MTVHNSILQSLPRYYLNSLTLHHNINSEFAQNYKNYETYRIPFVKPMFLPFLSSIRNAPRDLSSNSVAYSRETNFVYLDSVTTVHEFSNSETTSSNPRKNPRKNPRTLQQKYTNRNGIPWYCMIFVFVICVFIIRLNFNSFMRILSFRFNWTLLVLIDFCPVQGELITWSSVTKTLDILSEMIMEYQIQQA